MIRHVVLVRFAAGVGDEQIRSIFADLHRLKTTLAGITDISVGPNSSPEGLARGYGYAFTVDFVDAAARDRYLADPDHGKVGRALVAAAEGGVDGLLVIDFEPAP
jgi:hypothetical protein